MEYESRIEIAAKHAKRIGALELRHSDLMEQLRPDCRENPANPLTIFSKLKSLRESTNKTIVLKGHSTLNIAQESVFAYTQATFGIGTLRKIIDDASKASEATLVSQLSDSSLGYSIWRDVLSTFGYSFSLNYFRSHFEGGMNKGLQEVLKELEGKVPLLQYNKVSMARLSDRPIDQISAIKMPTFVEGIEIGYKYKEENSSPEIYSIVHPII